MSSKASESRPAEARRNIKTRLMNVLRIFIARIPPVIGIWLADRLGDIIYRQAGKSRRASMSNLRHVLGPVPKERLRSAVRGVFRNVMRDYYELIRASAMSDEELERHVDFDYEGWERLAAIQRQKRGVLLATAHFGAFDIITQMIGRRGVPVSFMVSQISPAWLSDFVTDMRAGRGLNVLVVEQEETNHHNYGALKESLTRLRRGEVLGVVVDRNIEHQGADICFFGYTTRVPTGVAKMALRTHSAVVLGICYRLPGGKYKVMFEPPIEATGSSSNQEDVTALLQTIFSRLEAHIKRAPDNWLLLQRSWPAHG